MHFKTSIINFNSYLPTENCVKMLNLKIVKKIFGDKYAKNIKELSPVVDEINQEYEKIKDLSDDELRQKTVEFKEKIQNETSELREQIDEIKKQLQSDEIGRASCRERV